MTTLTHSSPSLASVRGSAPAAPSRFARARTAVWQALSAVGQSRGRAALLELAREHEATRPALAAQLRSTARRGWL